MKTAVSESGRWAVGYLSLRALTVSALAYAVLSGSLYILGTYPRHRAESAWMVFGALFIVLSSLLVGARHSDGTEVATPRVRLWMFLVAACVLYLPSFTVGRLSDDFVLLAASGRWDLVPVAWEYVRPLPLAVWGILSAVGLGTPVVLHAANILLHGLNAYLVWRLGLELGLGLREGLAAALLFLVFPGAVETVTWIAGLQDVLMTTFVLGFVLAGLSGRFVAAALMLIAGTVTKETAVSAPVLLLLIRTLRPVPSRIILFGLVWAAVFGVARLTIGQPDDFVQAPSRYLLKEFFSRLFGGLALPWTHTQIAQAPSLAVGSVAGLAALLATHLLRARHATHQRAVLALGAWCVASAAPVYLYLFVGPGLEGSRYLYLPSVGWVLILSFLGFRGRGTRIAQGAWLLLLALGICGSLLQQGRWRTAADHRDQVLLEAEEAALAAGCAVPYFVGGPESLDGAYVFRNGLNEAFGELRQIPEGAVPDCRLAWTDGRFVPD